MSHDMLHEEAESLAETLKRCFNTTEMLNALTGVSWDAFVLVAEDMQRTDLDTFRCLRAVRNDTNNDLIDRLVFRAGPVPGMVS